MNNASVIGKILVGGELFLKTPLLIGDGLGEDSENTRDIHVLRDQNGTPFIPGTSLCGVLREYAKSRFDRKSFVELFGDANTMQSSLAIDDVLLEGETAYRDGVRIDGETGTADAGGKYDFEVVERGARGRLNILVTLRRKHDPDRIKNAIARLMRKLIDGVRLGAMTSKGFGSIAVENIRAGLYDFGDRSDVAAWLKHTPPSKTIEPADASETLNPNDLLVEADFALNSSFIIRDCNTSEKHGDSPINAVSLKSSGEFVIPGTRLKGVLRHRAEYILERLGVDASKLNELMGFSIDDKKLKSRFIVDETYLSNEKVRAAIQTRTRLDRFTGGVMQNVLFTTKPVWKLDDRPSITIRFSIRNASAPEIGLALALLRDLWCGRVALGGEKSIGRGTLQGISARIAFDGQNYALDRSGKTIEGDANELMRLANALGDWRRN